MVDAPTAGKGVDLCRQGWNQSVDKTDTWTCHSRTARTSSGYKGVAAEFDNDICHKQYAWFNHELSEGGMTCPKFNMFLTRVCEKHNAYNACFVFDNAPAHRQAANADLQENFNIQNLPPYSSFLNICENAFPIWKSDLKERLSEVRAEIHKPMTNGWQL